MRGVFMKKNNQKRLDNICFITYIDKADDSENNG